MTDRTQSEHVPEELAGGCGAAAFFAGAVAFGFALPLESMKAIERLRGEADGGMSTQVNGERLWSGSITLAAGSGSGPAVGSSVGPAAGAGSGTAVGSSSGPGRGRALR